MYSIGTRSRGRWQIRTAVRRRYRWRAVASAAVAAVLAGSTLALAQSDQAVAGTVPSGPQQEVAAAGAEPARFGTDYEQIRSLLWSMFDVRDDFPNNVDYSYNADIDNYYVTVFVLRASDGREHELARYQPKGGGEIQWGWIYERYREGRDRYHQAQHWLTYDAEYPPGPYDVLQDETIQYDDYYGRIWCWQGRDMVMVTNKMIAAAAGIYKYQLKEDPSAIFIDLAQKGAELLIEPVYEGQMPEQDYCTEYGYEEG